MIHLTMSNIKMFLAFKSPSEEHISSLQVVDVGQHQIGCTQVPSQKKYGYKLPYSLRHHSYNYDSEDY
jgi:hypothetical protein